MPSHDRHERKEAIVRRHAHLERNTGSYTDTDRRAALGLPTAMQPMANATLDSIVTMFNVQL